MEESALNILYKTYKVKEYLIKDYKHWIWSIRPAQCTLGASIVCMKRQVPTFSNANEEEMAELAIVAKDVESVLKGVFQFQKINWLALMMVDQQVHFHVVPRYSTKKEFAGVTWEDTGWPRLAVLVGQYVLGGEDTNPELVSKIISAVKAGLNR